MLRFSSSVSKIYYKCDYWNLIPPFILPNWANSSNVDCFQFNAHRIRIGIKEKLDSSGLDHDSAVNYCLATSLKTTTPPTGLGKPRKIVPEGACLGKARGDNKLNPYWHNSLAWNRDVIGSPIRVWWGANIVTPGRVVLFQVQQPRGDSRRAMGKLCGSLKQQSGKLIWLARVFFSVGVCYCWARLLANGTWHLVFPFLWCHGQWDDLGWIWSQVFY